jgi:type IV fimbrial biogenesis protein FimT
MHKLDGVKIQGFTLVEVIITIAVLAILLSVAVPSFKRIIERNQVITTSNDMLASLLLARSEAVTREENMVFAKITKWDNGWTVKDTSNNEILNHRTSNPNLKVTAEGSNTANSLTYTAQGRTTPALTAGSDYFKISQGDSERCIIFATTGRPSSGDCP